MTVKREITKFLPLLQAGAQQYSVSTELLGGCLLSFSLDPSPTAHGRALVWEGSHHLACMLQVTGPKHFTVLTHPQHTPLFLALATHCKGLQHKQKLWDVNV